MLSPLLGIDLSPPLDLYLPLLSFGTRRLPPFEQNPEINTD